jgi:Flp pilus assembly protein TadD
VTVHLFLFAVTGCLLAACGGSSSDASSTVPLPSFATAIGAGMAALKQGNPNAAQQLFADALKREPHNATAYFDEGVAYQRLGDTKQAEIAYIRALSLDPNYVQADFNRAVLVTPTDPALATFLYRKVIAMQPNSPTALLNLGLLEFQQGLRSDAVTDLAKAVQLQPSLAARIPATVRSGLAGVPAAAAHSGSATTTTGPG